MWHYYQTTHDMKEKWKGVEDKHAQRVQAEEATHMTMLSVDIPDSESADYSKARYFGDMVIDIDHPPEELDLAIKSANKVLDFFSTRCDLAYLKLYASGKKGFHIHIPWKLMHPTKKPLPDLHKKYAAIAQRIIVETGATGFDTGLYAGRKGHMVRVPNKERADGRYKVPLTVHELRNLTPDKYLELTEAPRNIVFDEPQAADIRMVGLYRDAKVVERGEMETVPDEVLGQFGDGSHPECVSSLVYWKRERQDINFDQRAFQLAIYLKSVQMSDTERSNIIRTFAAQGHSSTYRTAQEREQHTIAKGSSVRERRFSCGGMRSVLEAQGMCSSCPVAMEMAQARAEDESGIKETEDGLYYVNPDGVHRRLTDFTIEMEDFVASPDHVGVANASWERATFIVLRDGIRLTTIKADRSCLETARDFRSTFLSVRGAKIHVTDKDVERLQIYLTNKYKESPSMTPTHAVGLRTHTYLPDDGGPPRDALVWVEPGYSTDTQGLSNTFQLVDPMTDTPVPSVPNLVSLRNRRVSDAADPEISHALSMLLQCSRPDVVGRMLGWMMATHLKPIVTSKTQSFPLLHLHGDSQSGKTSLAVAFSSVAGADYRDRPDAAPGMTAWPMKLMVASSTSVPRVLDEVSKNKISVGGPGKWRAVAEALKLSYQHGNQSTGVFKRAPGRARSSAGVVSLRATAPMVILGIEEMQEAELWNRVIDVRVTATIHGEEDGLYTRSLHAIHHNPHTVWERLFDFHKQAVTTTMGLVRRTKSYDKIWEWYQEANKLALPMQAQHLILNYSYLYLGMSYFIFLLDHLGYDEALQELARGVFGKTREWLEANRTEIIVSRTRGEVDEFISGLAMFTQTPGPGGKPIIEAGKHYVRKGTALYLNLPLCWFDHMVGLRRAGMKPEYAKAQTLETAIKGHVTYLGAEALPALRGSSLWHKVDLDKLSDRGVDINCFEED